MQDRVCYAKPDHIRVATDYLPAFNAHRENFRWNRRSVIKKAASLRIIQPKYIVSMIALFLGMTQEGLARMTGANWLLFNPKAPTIL